MRYLFVLARQKADAESLIHDLGLGDVRVIGVEKSEREVPSALLAEIVSDKTPIALCGIERSYRRSFGELDFGFLCKEFRKKDLNLAAWLVPVPPPPPEGVRSPRQSFEQAAAAQSNLVFAVGALDAADNLATHRWPFAHKAAQLLADQAMGKAVGAPKDWRELHQVHYARNGNVLYTYDLPGRQGKQKSDWHLKDGDNTTAEAAARIYFDSQEVSGTRYVLIFYVGPHPPDGTYFANFAHVQWPAG